MEAQPSAFPVPSSSPVLPPLPAPTPEQSKDIALDPSRKSSGFQVTLTTFDANIGRAVLEISGPNGTVAIDTALTANGRSLKGDEALARELATGINRVFKTPTVYGLELPENFKHVRDPVSGSRMEFSRNGTSQKFVLVSRAMLDSAVSWLNNNLANAETLAAIASAAAAKDAGPKAGIPVVAEGPAAILPPAPRLAIAGIPAKSIANPNPPIPRVEAPVVTPPTPVVTPVSAAPVAKNGDTQKINVVITSPVARVPAVSIPTAITKLSTLESGMIFETIESGTQRSVLVGSSGTRLFIKGAGETTWAFSAMYGTDELRGVMQEYLNSRMVKLLATRANTAELRY